MFQPWDPRQEENTLLSCSEQEMDDKSTEVSLNLSFSQEFVPLALESLPLGSVLMPGLTKHNWHLPRGHSLILHPHPRFIFRF